MHATTSIALTRRGGNRRFGACGARFGERSRSPHRTRNQGKLIMALTDLPRLADQLPGFSDIVELLHAPGATGAVEIEGLAGPAKGFALARLFARLERPLLVLTYQQEQAQRLWDDLVRFGVPGERVCVLPSSQSLFLEGDITDFRVIGERIGALSVLAQGEPCIVIGTPEAVLQRTSPPDALLP